MLKLLTLFRGPGLGIGGHVPTARGFGNRSWGGCTEALQDHDCKGHSQDQQLWQHECRCGFRWAAKPKETM